MEEEMPEIILSQDQLKELVKTAITEILQENKEVFSELLVEAIEDIAIERAIQEGESTESTSREAIFKLLEP